MDDDIGKLPVSRRTRNGRFELQKRLLERTTKREQQSCGNDGAGEGSKRRKVSGRGKDKVEEAVILLSDGEEDFIYVGERDVGSGEDDAASRVFVAVNDEDEDEDEDGGDDDFEEEKEVDVKEEEEEDDNAEEVEVEVEEEEEEEEDLAEVNEEEEIYSVDYEEEEDEDQDDHDFVGTTVSEDDSEECDSSEAADEEEEDDDDDDDYVEETCGEEEVNQVRFEGSDDEDEVISISDDDESNDEDIATTSSPKKFKPVELKKSNQDTGRNESNEKAKEAERSEDQEPEPESSKSTKKKLGPRALEELEVQKILAASILEEEEGSFPYEEQEQEQVPEPPPVEWKLPWKFDFPEPPPPPEKSDSQKDIEATWSEMVLSMSQIEANQSQMDEDNPDAAPELDTASRCSRGDHYFLLNDEVGTICKFCYKVGVEIRHIVPPMSKNHFGGTERRTYARMPNGTSNDIDCEHPDFGSQSGPDPIVDFSGTVWSVIPGIRRGMHPHQIDGFEFLWKKIAGGIRLDDLGGNASSSRGSGCVISHAPGTGKSRLTIVFLETYVKLYPSCRPVIIAPACMLQTWEAEFKKWNVEVPFHNLNNNKITGKENKEALKLLNPRGQNAKSIRLTKLYSWKNGNGILALSYRLFEGLTGEGDKKEGRLNKNVWEALMDFPGLLILDEGHTARNNNSLIWKALSRMHTGKKIILSGTPFQNNFEELFNVLCLVRPEFAEFWTGSKKTDAREYWDSVTSGIGKSDNQNLESIRVEQVRDMIAPFMHVHKGDILQARLPGLRDAVVVLEPAGVQKQLLDRIDENIIHQNFEMEHAVSVSCVHPYLLCTKARDPAQRRRPSKPSQEKKSLIDFDMSKLESLKWDPDAGVKTKFLMELVQLSVLVDEKVLVFSQYVEPLNLISKQLEDRFGWSERREILIMHGRIPQDQRQAMLRNFNDPRSLSKVMLASTKACSEGISLVGASRVVLLDVVWNPSVGKQAISRAYRLGQERVVYIYHLLASALEEAKYMRQAQKERWSDMVIYSADKQNGSEKHLRELTDDKEDKLLEEMVGGDKLKDIFKQIIFQPKDCNLLEAFSYG